MAHWLTRHGSPTIYRCLALKQLLYRWRNQSGILWMFPRSLQTSDVGHPCTLGNLVRWPPLYVGHLCTLATPVRWPPCTLGTPVRWPPLYVGHPCTLATCFGHTVTERTHLYDVTLGHYTVNWPQLLCKLQLSLRLNAVTCWRSSSHVRWFSGV
jgi:hypothetical protein